MSQHFYWLFGRELTRKNTQKIRNIRKYIRKKYKNGVTAPILTQNKNDEKQTIFFLGLTLTFVILPHDHIRNREVLILQRLSRLGPLDLSVPWMVLQNPEKLGLHRDCYMCLQYLAKYLAEVSKICPKPKAPMRLKYD